MEVYLDNNRASVLDTQVLEAMQPIYTEHYADPTALHSAAIEARVPLTQAFEKIRTAIHAKPEDAITFGASADALHSRLLIATYLNSIITGQKDQIILSANESDAVYETAATIASQGCRVTILPLGSDGIIDLSLLKQIITPKTALVSLSMVDSQTGAIMPIDEVSQICAEYEVPLHSDATHAIGKLPVDMQMLGLDYLTLSTGTVHGPATAILTVKEGRSLPGLITPAYSRADIVGIGKALELADDAQAFEMEDVRELRDTLEEAIRKIPESLILTSWALRVPHTIMVGFKGVQSEALVWELSRHGINISSEKGRTLIENIGLDKHYKHTLVSFALSRYTTEEEIHYTIEKLTKAVSLIREERAH